jgi:ABC-type antimicrobial peptide transport system permease subunit
MSFTVVRRTREIGVRTALGASAPRVVGAVLRRPLGQVGLGVAVGGVLAGGLFFTIQGGPVSAAGSAQLAAYVAFMLTVCLLACVVPTRRALRIPPTEALRADG